MKAYIAKGRVIDNEVVACLISENNYYTATFNDSVQVANVGLERSSVTMNEVELCYHCYDGVEYSDLMEAFNYERLALNVEFTHSSDESTYQVRIGENYVDNFNKVTKKFFEDLTDEIRDMYAQDIEDEFDNEQAREDERMERKYFN